MSHWKRPLVAAFAALFAVAVLSAGCSADPPPPRWEKVTSGSLSGAQTQRLDLGTFYLTKGARIGWRLSGPADARAVFSLEVFSLSDADSFSVDRTSVRSWKENFALRSDEALVIGIREPSEYHLTLTQRLARGADVGYAGTFTLYTRDND